jgi:hypothetical protein
VENQYDKSLLYSTDVLGVLPYITLTPTTIYTGVSLSIKEKRGDNLSGRVKMMFEKVMEVANKTKKRGRTRRLDIDKTLEGY